VQIHATVVSINGNGVVLRGPSGGGKSDLALRLIGGGAVLVADDRCDIMEIGNAVVASAPAEIAGMLEVRGLGIFRLDCLASVPVALMCELSNDDDIERLPAPSHCTDLCKNTRKAIPSIRLAPFEASAPDKVRMALRHAIGELESVS